MQIMTCKQWHSNDRKGKMNTRTCVKIKKTVNQENILLLLQLLHTTKMYLNRKRLRIIKDSRLKLLRKKQNINCSLGRKSHDC